MQPERQPTHLIIARACDADTEGANAQARIGFVGEPGPEVLDSYRDAITSMYREGFGRDPERVGVVVLPWVGDLDDDD